MHVLHVVNETETGGAQTLIEALGRHRAAGQHISCVVIGPAGALHERIAAAVDHIVTLGFSRRSYRMDQLVRRLRSVIDALRPDVVQSHLFQSDLAAYLAIRRMPTPPPLIWTVHASGLSRADPMRSRVLVRALARISPAVSAVVACSSSAEQFLQAHRYASGNVRVIDNGVPLSAAEPIEARDKTLVHLARFHPMKDHPTLVEAYRRAVQRGLSSRLICAGLNVDESNEELRGLLARAGISDRVSLCGTVTEPRALVANAQALLISSSYGEALPMAGLEALSVGTPVVTTDVGSCARLAAEDWLLVPAQDPEALAQAICRVDALSKEQHRTLAAAARERASAFDVRTTVTRYAELYDTVSERARA